MSDDNKEVDLNKMLNSESQNNDIEKVKQTALCYNS